MASRHRTTADALSAPDEDHSYEVKMVSVAQPITGNTARRGIGAWMLISLALIAFVLTLLFVGALAALLPWWFLIALSAAPIFIIISWRFPELALTILFAVSFGLVPDFLLPKLPIAGGALRAEDLGLFAMLALLLVKNIKSAPQLLSVVARPIKVLLPFIAIAAISAIVAILYAKSGVKDVFNEARNYAYWLYLPLIALAIKGEADFRRFYKLLFALAIVIAAVMIIQSVTGIKITTRGQFSELWTVSDTVAGITRSTTPGMFLMAGTLLWLLVAYSMGEIKFGFLTALAVIVLLGGVIVGFGRGLWASLFIGFVLVGLVDFSARYLRMAAIFAVLFSIFGSITMVAKPDIIDAVVRRATSVTEEFERGTSIGRRKIENQYALDAALGSPLQGVGVGGRYKPYGVDSAAWEAESRYIHNTYLHAAAKTGFPGFVALVFAVLYLLRSSWMVFRSSKHCRALAFVSFWVILSTGILTAMTQPNWLGSTGVLSVCLALYFTEYVRRSELRRDAGARLKAAE